MNREYNMITLSPNEKERYISALTEELRLLRTKACLTQEQISYLIGISRQTYYAIETKQRKMPWNMYMSLMFLFTSIEETQKLTKQLNVFPRSLIDKLNGEGKETYGKVY